MEVVPGKMGQRGINLQAEKTPNVGNPQRTNTKERLRIATTIFKIYNVFSFHCNYKICMHLWTLDCDYWAKASNGLLAKGKYRYGYVKKYMWIYFMLLIYVNLCFVNIWKVKLLLSLLLSLLLLLCSKTICMHSKRKQHRAHNVTCELIIIIFFYIYIFLYIIISRLNESFFFSSFIFY